MGELTKREKALVEWIRVQGSASLSQVAEQFGVTLSTAGVHLHRVKNKGYLANSKGRFSTWHVVEGEVLPKSQPANIEQVASIWHYAARHAAPR